jgi:hypothetical protein
MRHDEEEPVLPALKLNVVAKPEERTDPQVTVWINSLWFNTPPGRQG